MNVREEFKAVLAEMVGGVAQLPATHADVQSAAQHLWDHLLVEVATIREIERQRKLKD